MSVLLFFYFVLTFLLAPFFLYLLLITVAAYVRRRARFSQEATSTTSLPRFAFIIPAHDEEGQIADTVRSCLAVDYDPKLVSVTVIADNCTDQTARAAREAGAVVVERTDPARRSKGYALEYLLGGDHRFLNGPAADAVVVIDADTVVDAEILRAFARSLTAGVEWVQGYLTVRNPDLSWRTRLMTHAFSLINGVWLSGLEGLGLSVSLRGNGMCLATCALERCPWEAHGLAEDIEFSWVLRTAGERVVFQGYNRKSCTGDRGAAGYPW
jgi:cellulose synthase/poly-beta-1,6-N-acetylglucosamine synthase-like glycosyltransferase